MPIISQIGRKAPRVRLLIWTIYAVLTFGSLTMVYPFMIMIAGSTKSGVDVKDFDPIPRFIYDDAMLYRKHVEGLFNESLDAVNIAFDGDIPSFEDLEPPETPNRALADEWAGFIAVADPPGYCYDLGYTSTIVSRTMPRSLRELKQELMTRFGKDIEAMNRKFGTEFVSWNSVFLLPEDYLLRRNKPPTTDFSKAVWDFKKRQPLSMRYCFCVEGFYKRLFLKPQYTKDIAEYNRTHDTTYESYREVKLPRTYPDKAPQQVRQDWESFVRNTLNLLWIRVRDEGKTAYRQFLQSKYRQVDVLNRNYRAEYADFSEIPLIEEPPASGIALSDWESFIVGWKDPDTGQMHVAPRHALTIHSLDFMFLDHLQSKYSTVTALNQGAGTSFASFADILPPQRDYHYLAFNENRGKLRLEFITRNYKAVLQYMLFHGRGILNTVIYCSLAIALALLVNPLAAYAMSRYQMPTAYKILLFLLLTMAFPPMVTQIPVFLMLRQLGLLNTFAALVLPGMANGYSIFLLKGFFDSLPRELYESAEMDGANEWIMFWNITMSLSKPILAVIALNTFTLAYSNFMFALLLCQDEKMWTIMVWLYQLQGRSGQGVIYASLIIAGIPTLLVFVFCQNIIMRGIVVPVEK